MEVPVEDMGFVWTFGPPQVASTGYLSLLDVTLGCLLKDMGGDDLCDRVHRR